MGISEHTFWQRVEVLFHQALNPAQVQLNQDVVELRALLIPLVDDVLQIRDGQLLKAFLQELKYFVSRQSFHLRQIFSKDLSKEETLSRCLSRGLFKLPVPSCHGSTGS